MMPFNNADPCHRVRRHMQTIAKECQFSLVPSGAEEVQDMGGPVTFYDIDKGSQNAFPPLQVGDGNSQLSMLVTQAKNWSGLGLLCQDISPVTSMSHKLTLVLNLKIACIMY